MDNSDIILLKEACECGIINTDVSDTIIMIKKEKVSSVHSYTITAPQNASARWQTYIKGENGNRVKVSAISEKALYEKLYNHYFVMNAYTLKTLFSEWIDKRNEQGVSPRTVRRNINHWDKYYKNNPIVDKPICKLNAECIEKFFHESIKSYNLSVKELGNMKFIMVDMMKLAKKRNLISTNPMIDVDVKVNACRPVKKQNDTSRVYLPEEKEKLFAVLNDELHKKPNCSDAYVVFLLFKLGLRIGEVVALKWSDIDFDNKELHIHRMQTMDNDEFGNLRDCIVEYTKKKSPYGDRFLPLSKYEMDIFRSVALINSRNGYGDDEFIFCDEKGRTRYRAIDNLIRKCCNKANIPVKSAHDIRRTVASEMFNNHVPVEIIRNYLGHSDIKTTYSYILDNQRKSDTNKMILNSLNSLNGLMGTQVS